MTQVETLIIGGGVAGLHSAMRLHQSGHSFMLIEASEQLGGRIRGNGQHNQLDMGPTWIWPHQKHTLDLLQHLDIDYFEQFVDGNVIYQSSPNEITHHPGTEPMQYFRVSGGMQQIISKLAAAIPENQIHTSTLVKSIERHLDIWHVTVQRGQTEERLTASKLVMAIPPRMIAYELCDKVWLSDEIIKHLASQQTWMAAQAKFVATYSTPFWRQLGSSGQVFSRVGPMIEIHDACDEHAEIPALFGFIGITPESRKLLGEDKIKADCVAQLTSIFGEQASEPTAIYYQDWSNETYITTQADCLEVSQHANVNIDQLEKDAISADLYFAGSEFSHIDPGYIEGAIVASSRAVSLLLKQLKQD